MKKFFKTLGGYALVYLGSKLARDADELHRQAAQLVDEGDARRARSNMAWSMGFKLLGDQPGWTIFLRPEDLDDEDEEEEEEEAGPLH